MDSDVHTPVKTLELVKPMILTEKLTGVVLTSHPFWDAHNITSAFRFFSISH